MWYSEGSFINRSQVHPKIVQKAEIHDVIIMEPQDQRGWNMVWYHFSMKTTHIQNFKKFWEGHCNFDKFLVDFTWNVQREISAHIPR